jgi:diguanylate cyclase (GGDEF)-like protein
LFVDIDRFKLVNDSLGHAIGDQLLIGLALRIREVLRPGDTIARIGGDEFTLLLDGVSSVDDAIHVADRVQSSLARPFRISGHELFVTASVGIALGGSGMEAEGLLRDADIAMYQAKGRGRGSIAAFDESMRDQVVDRLARENELHLAVEQALIAVHYQPIIDLATGRIRGLEALARWPEGWPALAPAEFIPIAEETGVIGELGLQVLRTALATLGDWRRAGVVSDEVCISVNLSGCQLDDPQLPEDVLAEIRAAGLPPSSLWLEITESTLMNDPGRMQRIVSEVCGAGVGLHLDDFGTGQSSLAALHQFPVNALKIDRSIVSAITGNGDGSGAIVRSTVALAHALGLEVIAEGIEDPVGLSRLRTLGCEYGQGFLFSKPLSAEETQSLLAGWSPSQAAALGEQITPA